ncbi:MAG: universal stress protein [Nakamurella sp.]
MNDPRSAGQGSAESHDALKPVRSLGSGRIVVGVDGSPGSLAALRFALAEARLRDAEVQALCAWHYLDTFGGPEVLPEGYDLRAEAERTVNDAVAAVDPAERAGVLVTPSTPHGSPAQVLLDAAAGADLLVVGTRGHGGFTGLLLGSVSAQCVHHAPCPVVVIPASRS